MKKFVKLLPALVMLLISAILVSTTTYAWFSMNSQVTATNMKVKAVAEQGIVISDSAKGTWSNLAESQFNTTVPTDAPVELLPTSTTETATPAWVHAMSPNEDDANASLTLNGTTQNYQSLTLAWSETDGVSSPAVYDEGIGYVEDATPGFDATELQYVRRDVFYIRAASTDMTGGTLYINGLTVNATSNATGSQTRSSELNKALRVLVVLTEQGGTNAGATHPFLFAPVGGYTANYYWNDETHSVAANAVAPRAAGAAINVDTGIDDVFNDVDAAIRVDVYTFFEGEDAALKSTNAGNTIAMDTLDTTIVFGTTTVS